MLHSVSDKAECLGLSRRHRGHKRTTRAGCRRRAQSRSRRNQERAPLGLRSQQDVTDDYKKEKKRGPVRSVAEVRWLSIPLEDGEVVSDTSKDTTNYYLFLQIIQCTFPAHAPERMHNAFQGILRTNRPGLRDAHSAQFSFLLLTKLVI